MSLFAHLDQIQLQATKQLTFKQPTNQPKTRMDLFSKNGALTRLVESVPGGGLITAPIHAAAGNTSHAANAALQGSGFGHIAAAGQWAGIIKK